MKLFCCRVLTNGCAIANLSTLAGIPTAKRETYPGFINLLLREADKWQHFYFLTNWTNAAKLNQIVIFILLEQYVIYWNGAKMYLLAYVPTGTGLNDNMQKTFLLISSHIIY